MMIIKLNVNQIPLKSNMKSHKIIKIVEQMQIKLKHLKKIKENKDNK